MTSPPSLRFRVTDGREKGEGKDDSGPLTRERGMTRGIRMTQRGSWKAGNGTYRPGPAVRSFKEAKPGPEDGGSSVESSVDN